MAYGRKRYYKKKSNKYGRKRYSRVRRRKTFRRTPRVRVEKKHMYPTTSVPVAMNTLNNAYNAATSSIDYRGLALVQCYAGALKTARIGNLITIKSIYIRGTVKYSPGSNERNDGARVQLLMFMDTSWADFNKITTTLPDPMDLFETSGLNAPLNNDFTNRYKVLLRKNMNFSADHRYKDITYFKNMNLPIRFIDEGGEIGSWPSNRQIFLYLRADPGSFTDDTVPEGWTSDISVSVAFTDA